MRKKQMRSRADHRTKRFKEATICIEARGKVAATCKGSRKERKEGHTKASTESKLRCYGDVQRTTLKKREILLMT